MSDLLKSVKENASFSEAIENIMNGGVSAYSYWKKEEFMGAFNGILLKSTGEKYHPTIEEVTTQDWILFNK